MYYYIKLVGICTNPCPCCKKMEKRKHDCTHEFCETNCPRKLNEINYTRNIHFIKKDKFGFSKPGEKRNLFAIKK